MSTKIHAVVDQDGLPVRLLITPGQASDKAAVPALLEGLPPADALVADRGYDSMAIIELVQSLGASSDARHEGRIRPARLKDRGPLRQPTSRT